MKLRVYQIAKEMNRSAHEIIAVLEKLGIEGKHHTSSIEDELVPKIRRYLEPYAKRAEVAHKDEEVVEEPELEEETPKPVAVVPAPKVEAPVVEKGKKKVAKEAAPKEPVREVPRQPVKEAKRRSTADHPKVAKPSAEAVVAVADRPSEPSLREPLPPAPPTISDEELEQLTAPPPPAPAAVAVVSAPVVERPKIQISENIAVKDLAQKMGIMSKLVLKKLLDRGILANINQNIDLKLAEQLASDFGFDVNVTSYEEAVAKEQETDEASTVLVTRPPVVTIMGHVDHGKTSLLDAIRETNVAGGESGGITQHIGAYQVRVGQRGITFIDTPGHEAFTRMRARGAQVTDIVVLVVAADDGVMPQTLEAIDHAKAAKVPIIVAINKIDKPDANPDRIKRQLADHEILIEEYGGDTVCVEISARKRTNIPTLLEMILLVADILDLKSSPNRLAAGTVLEARLDKSRGPAATVLVQNGTLKAGDVYVVGAVMGRVRAMFDDRGAKMKEATPGNPVEVLGSQGVPQAGDAFQVFKDEFKARSIVAFRQARAKELAAASTSRLSLDQLFSKIQQGEIRELPVIVKADVQGSIEVMKDTLTKLGTEEVKIRMIHSGTGAVTSSDVLLASASNAIIVAYNVRPEPKARELAEKEKVDIRTYTVIYSVVNEIKSALSGLLRPTIKEVFLGTAEVRDTFRIPKVGTVAGSYIVSGKLNRNAQVRLVRDNVVIYEGKISSLRRFKEDASEVKEGFECGVGLENYNDIKIGDYIEAFTIERIARHLE
ncbi:translation initiation factor IF-2 [bacterium]|nr:translation initiation factor IF-2 [bacterium]